MLYEKIARIPKDRFIEVLPQTLHALLSSFHVLDKTQTFKLNTLRFSIVEEGTDCLLTLTVNIPEVLNTLDHER